MYLSKEIKEKIFKKYGKSKSNTGSTEGQIALLNDFYVCAFSACKYNYF